MSNRYRANRRFDYFYKTIHNNGVCVYCGALANTLDHFVPLSVKLMLADVIGDFTGTFKVRCCTQCNSTAGNKVFKTIAAKRRYIQECYKEKYKKLLALPHWTDAELADLGYSLQTKIKSDIERKKIILRRLAWNNTKNPESAKLVKIHFKSAVIGKGFAQQNVAKNGMERSDSGP